MRNRRVQHAVAERVQRQHVEGQVNDAAVGEVRGQHADAVAPAGDLVRDEEELLGRRSGVRPQGSEPEEAHDHVHRRDDVQDGHRASPSAVR
jgi:hypothetical protein